MFNIILFGAPGSGKGTQSENLISYYGLKHLSTGDLLRKETAAGTPLGLMAKSFSDKGQLVPDEVVIGIISSALDEHPGVPGFLFDGFPRTVPQAEALDKLMELKRTSIDLVLVLQVNEDELIHRLIHRAKTSGRLDDADPEIQKKRQQIYNQQTLPVAAYYKRKGKVEMINGEGTIEEIFERLQKSINSKRYEKIL